MTKVLLLILAVLGSFVFIEACSPESSSAAHPREVDTTETRYSAEVYYQLLVYIKTHMLTAIDDCPKCKCFNDGTCLDLCDAGVWP